RPLKPSEADSGLYLELEDFPLIPEMANKVGYISGCNIETGEVMFSYNDIPTYEEIPEGKTLTDTERIMQSFTDAELRDLEIQQNQELLAQQMADIELAMLGGS